MRKTALLIGLTLSFFCIQYCYAQPTSWQNITPLGFTGDFKFMTFLKGGSLVAISNTGNVYHSSDTAKTWTVTPSPVTQVEDMKFYPDGKRGYIVSKTSLYYTADGGYTWSLKKITGTSGMTYFYCMYIKSEDTLFLATRNQSVGARIMLSADAGSNWTQVASNLFLGGNNAYSALLTFFFDTPSHGYALGQGYYASTNDGGKTWVNTSQGTTTFNCSATSNSQNEILVFTAGCITLSKTQNINNPETGMCADGFEGGVTRLGTTKICISADDHGNMLRSTDDGYTWTTTVLNSNKKFRGVVAVDNNTAIIYGNELTTFKTTDGGLTWKKIVHGGGEGFNNILCKSANECFITGKAGRLLRTQDGGDTWIWQDLLNTNPLHEITFPTQDTGYISASGLIFRTIDGGNSWQSFGQLTGGGILNFPSKNVGFIGYTPNSYVYKTIDAGKTWTSVPEKKGGGGGFSFISETIGICDGVTDGTIMYTNDGGQTWIEKDLPIKEPSGVREIIPNKFGWILLVQRNDFIDIYTCNFTLNISLVKSIMNNGAGLRQINDSTFFFCSSDSTYFSKDYGNTWSSYKYWTPINDIYFPNSQVSYAFGADLIYKSFFKSNLHISNLTISNKTLAVTLNAIDEVKIIAVVIKIVNNIGDTIYSTTETFKNGLPGLISLSNSVPDGTYTLFIEPQDTLLYSAVQSQPFTIVTTSSEMLETKSTINYNVIGNKIECDCHSLKIFNMLGQQMQEDRELQTGIYILQCYNVTQKIIIKP